jgi:hypothetical protein
VQPIDALADIFREVGQALVEPGDTFDRGAVASLLNCDEASGA